MPSSVTPAATRPQRSLCPVACALDVLGDRWTLLVVRDLMRGKQRFGEFLASPEGIPTNLLADRLQRLMTGGVVVARRYCEHPPRVEYTLTDKGEDLRPVIRAMVEWGAARGRPHAAAGREKAGYAFARIFRPSVSRSNRLSASHHRLTSRVVLPDAMANRLSIFAVF